MQRVLPLGEEVSWTPARRPGDESLRGAHVLVRPIAAADDAQALFAASHPADGDRSIWTYLPDGPYESPEQLREMLAWAAGAEDARYFALVPLAGTQPQGLAAYLRIAPEPGVVEIGHIWFGAELQRTTAATEAIYLLARHAFDDPRLSPPGVEVQRAQRRVPQRGRALRLHVRGHLSQAPDRQGPQPRYRLVLDPRRRVARNSCWIRGMAGAWEPRRRGPPETLAGGIEAPGIEPGALKLTR